MRFFHQSLLKYYHCFSFRLPSDTDLRFIMREIKPLLAIDDLKQSRLVNVHVTTHDGKEVPLTISLLEQTGDVKERVLGESAAKDLPNYKVNDYV